MRVLITKVGKRATDEWPACSGEAKTLHIENEAEVVPPLNNKGRDEDWGLANPGFSVRYKNRSREENRGLLQEKEASTRTRASFSPCAGGGRGEETAAESGLGAVEGCALPNREGSTLLGVAVLASALRVRQYKCACESVSRVFNAIIV